MRFRYALIFLALALVPVLGLAQVPSEVVNDVPAITSAAPDDAQPNGLPKFFQRDGDSFKSPQTVEAFQLRQQALRERLAGKGSGKIHQIAGGQYVELGLERTDKIFVVLVEYGNQVGDTRLGQAPGPQHNQIAQPDRTTDNNTAWQADYNRDHYRNMYFTKMADYYQKQSSGRYTVNGEVTEWVRVPFNGSRYGANTPLVADPGAWTLIADAINIWTQDRLNEGMTMEQIKAYLQTFDTWDRYDYNHNGNFNEPDGYIDHFQIVHSGAGEEAGGGILGADAIWSHRWFAFYTLRGSYGPDNFKNGGLEFGGGWGANPNGGIYGATGAAVLGVNTTNANAANVTNAHPAAHTGIWVGDYTIQPENGGLGVFAHEFGHDLGLPDHYDTNSGSNSISYWNIMASGSWLGDGGEDIGNTPGHMNAWDKLQLGWLNYDLAPSGKFSTHRLGPAETNTKAAQALVVSLPADKNVFLLYDPRVGVLPYGSKAWWGGAADSIDNNMVRPLSVPAGSLYLYMRTMYAIESGWDYAYVSVSADNGATWTNLVGQYQNGANWSNLTTTSNPNGNNLGNGITGSSSNAWRYARFSMSAYAGKDVLLRIRYKTDDYTYLKGFLVDEIALDTTYICGAETGDNGWTLNGFKAPTGVDFSNFDHYYIAEYRQYRDYDSTLQTGPYTFGFAFEPNRVAHYPYQDGLLITYWDTEQANDNTSQHYGEGRSLPVDAHPDPLLRYVAFPGSTPYWSPWLATVQSYDSTFGSQPTDAIDLPFYGTSGTNRFQWWQSHPSLPGVPVFNDLNTYWSPTTPQAGVIVPKTGTAIRVVNTNTQDNFMQVNVEPVK